MPRPDGGWFPRGVPRRTPTANGSPPDNLGNKKAFPPSTGRKTASVVPPEFVQNSCTHSKPVTAAPGPAFPPGSFGANQAAHHLPLLSAGDRGSLTGWVPLFSPATLLINILYHIAGENARAGKEKLSSAADCATMQGVSEIRSRSCRL